MKRMACAIALATGAGIGLTAAPTLARAESASKMAASGLQIAIGATGIGSDDSVILDVSYRGGRLAAVSLYIDGELVKTRALSSRAVKGTIQFELDPTLVAGDHHNIEIQATDLDGNTATATTQLHVTPSIVTSPIRLMFPRRDATLQGVVPIEVQVDESVHKPFVSFFVDSDFLELSNYAPYTYNWDSTRATNGRHTISIDVMDGETQAKVKTITIGVNVNNPGGLTNRQTVVPDLNRKAPGVVQHVQAGLQVAMRTAGHGAQFTAPDLGSGVATAGQWLTGDLRVGIPARDTASEGSRSNRIDFVAPDLNAGAPRRGGAAMTGLQPGAFAVPDHNLPGVHFTGVGAPVAHPGALALLSIPRDILQLRHDGLAGGRPASFTARPHRAGNLAMLPDIETPANRGGTGIAVRSNPAGVAPDTYRAQRTVHGTGAIKNPGYSLDIAFDNTRIAFDVPPRVEKGMPLAPFRQIFEHTGGTVQWFGHSRTVRAFNTKREIEFRIGHKQATVNNQAVNMDAQPYVDRGRAIVPLSFVRDALNVTVHYDAATGHLRIESRK